MVNYENHEVNVAICIKVMYAENMNYIPREIENELKKISSQFPVTLLTGPRQTGKSTLLKHLFPKYQYISFDDSSLRLSAKKDPAGFIESLRTPVIIDARIQDSLHICSNTQTRRPCRQALQWELFLRIC